MTGGDPQAGLVRTLLRLVGGLADGFVAGFAVGYVAATTLTGAGRQLGFGALGDCLLTLAVVLLALGIAWGAVLLVIAGAGWVRDRLGPALLRRGVPRIVRVPVMLPFRVIGGLPRVGIGLMAAVLFLIYGVIPSGAGGFLSPSAPLAPFIWCAGIVGAGLGLARAAFRSGDVRRRPLATGAAVVGIAVAVIVGLGGFATALDGGSTDGLVAADPILDAGSLPGDLPDPGLPGPYAVRTFSYGSGTDRRQAYGADARFTTPTVDASSVLYPLGWGADEARRLVWGFGPEALPLNGKVWMPEGDGPFPLVLIVHGNHEMAAPNEDGYAYLAANLASHGMTAVSVDESFLNGSWAGDWKGSEQRVRAWLLLQHLDQWRSWSADPSSPLHGTVDLDRLALVGHSRGGEAAAFAASMASSGTGTYALLRPWAADLAVRAVVSIAPSDGQAPVTVNLDGIDFLTMSGGYDADAMAWSGLRQYARTTPAGGSFKAAFYDYRANHGQFNTVWGRGDQGPWSGALLNLRPLPDPADQQRVASTAIGAFLGASLGDKPGYRAFFRRPMTGREWLPDGDVYVVRSEEDGRSPTVDLTDAGGSLARGMTRVRDGVTAIAHALPLRALQDTAADTATFLGWTAGPGEARWGATGIGAAARATEPTAIELTLADASTPPVSGEPPAPRPIVVEATTSDGVRVALPLSTWGALPPPLPTRLTKNDLTAALARLSGLDLTLRSPAEVVPQSYRIPLDAFAAADPLFDPARIDGLELRIPRGDGGSLAVVSFALR